MKNYSKFLFALLLFLAGLNSCERDDLCDSSQPSTPRLIITFVDAADTSERKAVPSLSILELTSNTLAPLNDTGVTSLAAVDSIAIPLDPNNNLTNYRFTQNDGITDLINEVEFTYTVDEEYINRACGFKNIYENLSSNLDNLAGTTPWIDNIEIVDNSVTNTNNIHVEIRH